MVDFNDMNIGQGKVRLPQNGRGLVQKDGTFLAINFFDAEFKKCFNGGEKIVPPEQMPLYPDLDLPKEPPKFPVEDENKNKGANERPELDIPEKGVNGKDNEDKDDKEIKLPPGLLPKDGDGKPIKGKNPEQAEVPKEPPKDDEVKIDPNKVPTVSNEEMEELVKAANKEIGDAISAAFEKARKESTPTQDTRASNGLNLADANKIYHHMMEKYEVLSKETMSPEDWALLQMANTVFAEIGTKANNDGVLPKSYDGWDTSKADELLGEKKADK